MGGQMSVVWENQLSDSFILYKRNVTHQQFEVVDVYQLKADSNVKLIRKLAIISDEQYKTLLQRVKIRHNNITRLVNVVKLDTNCINPTQKQCEIYFQHPGIMNLSEILQSKTTQFQEIHIWKIIYSIVSGAEYLQRNQRSVGNISTDYIYLNIDQFTIIEANLIPQIKMNYQNALNQKFGILSPEQLINLNQAIKIPQINNYQSDIYAFGILLIQLLTRIDPTKLYDYNQAILHTDLLEAQILSLKPHYSQLLVNLIKQLLKEDPDIRPSWLDLQNLLKQYENQIINEIPFYKTIIQSPYQTQQQIYYTKEIIYNLPSPDANQNSNRLPTQAFSPIYNSNRGQDFQSGILIPPTLSIKRY